MLYWLQEMFSTGGFWVLYAPVAVGLPVLAVLLRRRHA